MKLIKNEYGRVIWNRPKGLEYNYGNNDYYTFQIETESKIINTCKILYKKWINLMGLPNATQEELDKILINFAKNQIENL